MAAVMCLASCGGSGSSAVKTADERVPFSADSAYSYIEKQVSFGARVPGSEAHSACRDWIVAQLASWGLTAEEQQGVMTDYAGDAQTVRNIVVHIAGTRESAPAMLLCAHWDCRPWCDEEDDYDERFVPVMGANDGASGVGVLLEVARELQVLRESGRLFPAVDIVFFDCEDMGTPKHFTGVEREDTWCLGSQLWGQRYAATPAARKTKYAYGILLDMVGDPSATFPREYFSLGYAQSAVEQVWRTAQSLGYGRYFVNQNAYPITDDHYYVNTIAGVPCIDIIDYKMDTETGFPDWWHTQRDDMRNINKQTLTAVGETVMTILCSK